MGIDISDIFKTIKKMAKEFIILMMEDIMKETFKTTKEMEKAFYIQ